MVVEKKSISFKDEVFELVEKRVNSLSRSESVNWGLIRYYKLIFNAQLHLIPKFTDEEFGVIFYACGSKVLNIMEKGLVRNEVYNYYRFGSVTRTANIDIDVLTAKLSEISEIEQVALIELSERFWVEIGKQGRSDLTVKEFIQQELQLYSRKPKELLMNKAPTGWCRGFLLFNFGFGLYSKVFNDLKRKFAKRKL